MKAKVYMPMISTTGDPMPKIVKDASEGPEKGDGGIDDFDDRVPN
jgi:hypothetical protein